MTGKLIGGVLVLGTMLVVVASRSHGRRELSVKDTHRDVPSGARVDAIPANSDPCGWISATDVGRLLGQLSGTPRRGHDASNMEPAGDGRACVYPLAHTEPGATASDEVAIEVVIKDAMTHEASRDNAGALAGRILAGVGESDTTHNDGIKAKPAGWDYVAWFPNEYFGRVGHLGVLVRVNTHGTPFSNLPADSIERVAALIRDRIPDRPFMSSEADASAVGSDPCTLLSRAEAEAVVGKLAIDSYRSEGESPLVDPAGEGCSYYLGNHRVFTLKPEWDNGKALFGMSATANQMFASQVGAKPSAADTLDGPWDQAGDGLDGTLYFLKGDRMLSVAYRTASIGPAQALRLASVAVRRLAEK